MFFIPQLRKGSEILLRFRENKRSHVVEWQRGEDSTAAEISQNLQIFPFFFPRRGLSKERKGLPEIVTCAGEIH